MTSSNSKNTTATTADADIPAQKSAEPTVTVTEVVEGTVCDEVDNTRLGKFKAAFKRNKTVVLSVAAGLAFTAYVIVKNINSDSEVVEDDAEDTTS